MHLFNIIYEPERQPAWKHLFIGLMDEFISLYDQVGPIFNIEEQKFILRDERLRDMGGLSILERICPRFIGNINGAQDPKIKEMIIKDLLTLASYDSDEIYLLYKDDGAVWDAYRMFNNVSYIYKGVFIKWSPNNGVV